MDIITSISQEDFMEVNNLKNVQNFNAKVKNGRLYLYFAADIVTAITTSTTIFTIKEGFRPIMGNVVIPVRKTGTGYPEVGSLWISPTGKADAYGAISANAQIWVQAEYTFK